MPSKPTQTQHRSRIRTFLSTARSALSGSGSRIGSIVFSLLVVTAMFSGMVVLDTGISPVETAEAAPTNELHRWGFENPESSTVVDSVGANDGDLNGSTLYTGKSLNGSFAGYFNGSAKVPISEIDHGKTFTYSVSIKSNESDKTQAVVRNFAPEIGITLSNDNTIKAEVKTDTGEWKRVTTSGTYDQEATHVVATSDGSTLELYINGNHVNSTDISSVTLASDTTHQEYIGAAYKGDTPFHGTIDNLRVFNDSVSSSEAESLASGMGKTNEKTLSHWDFESGSGTATDKVGDADADLTANASYGEGLVGDHSMEVHDDGYANYTNSNLDLRYLREVSYEATVDLDVSEADRQTIMWNQYGEFRIWLHDGSWMVDAKVDNNEWYRAKGPVATSDPTRITGVYNYTHLKLYIDGNLVNTTETSGKTLYDASGSSADGGIGYYECECNDGIQHPSYGKIDDVVVSGTEVKGSVSQDTLNSKEVSGRVYDQNGDPVENVTVHATGWDRSNDPPTLGGEPLHDITDRPVPDEWDNQVSNLDGFSPTSYDPSPSDVGPDTRVFLHTEKDWEAGDISDHWLVSKRVFEGTPPDGVTPHPTIDESEQAMFACWKPDDSLVGDSIDSSISGFATTSCEVTVERVDPLGNVEDSRTMDTEPLYEVWDPRNFGSKTHEVAATELQPGVYRVYPNGNQEAVMYYTVAPSGDVNKLDDTLPNLNGIDDCSTLDRIWVQQACAELKSQGPLGKYVSNATTNSTGHYNLSAPSNAERVELVGVKSGTGLESGTNEPDEEAIRNEFEDAVNSNFRLHDEVRQPMDSFYEEKGRERFREICADMDNVMDDVGEPYFGQASSVVPNGNADIGGHRIIPPNVDQLTLECASINIVESLMNNNLGFIDGGLMDDISNLSPNEQREKLEEILPFLRGNDALQEEFESRTNVDLNSSDPDDYTNSEVETILSDGSTVIDETSGGNAGGGGGGNAGGGGGGGTSAPAVGGGSGEADEVAETISAQWPVGNVDDWEEAQLLLRLDWSNGTTTTLNQSSEYVSVEENTLGVDVVHLSDYPVGEKDPAAVNPRLDVATSDGHDGGNTGGVRNPTFDGTMPDTSHIKISTLAPGPNDRVTVSADGGESFGGIKRIEVTNPDGSKEEVAASEGAANFTTGGAGDHRVAVTVANSEGTEFVEVLRVRAKQTTQDRPPTLKASVGPTGRFAVIGNGMERGSIDVRDGASEIRIIGVLKDDPKTVSIHTTNADIASDATHSIELRKGAEEKAIDSSPRILLHQQKVSEEAIFWRNDHALPRGEQSTEGIVKVKNSSTVVDTFAEAGKLEVRSIDNPGPVQRLRHWADLRLPGMPFLTVSIPSIPMPTEVLPILFAFVLKRRDPPEPPEPPAPKSLGGPGGPREVTA